MTLPPERIGDRGRRFVAQCKDWPDEAKGWQNCAYSDTRIGAEKACEAFEKHPGVFVTRVIDRKPLDDTVNGA